jgi:hypothetical protein
LPAGVGERSKVVFATEQLASPKLDASGDNLMVELPPYSGVVIAEQ